MATVQPPDATKSCLSLVRTACRTRGGLAVLGHNTDMRMHVVLRSKIDKPLPFRGRGASRLGGGSNSSSYCGGIDSWTSNKDESARCENQSLTHTMGKAKKPSLKVLPPDWRETLWRQACEPRWRESRPQLLPALAVLWLTGCRSAELAAGAQVAVRAGRLLIKLRGAKCIDAGGRQRGQPTRIIGFATDDDANPALTYLYAMSANHTIDGTAQFNIAHDKDYLYNSVVQLGKSAFPKLRTRISPNCFRHQVASDMKADPEISLEHAAKVMGHLSDYSIGKYGHAAHGRKGKIGKITAPFVQTSREIKHSPKVDRLARFKIASAKRRDHKPN